MSDDYILQRTCRELDHEASKNVAPKPLLPNWGAGNSRPYAQDINMMALHNSKERTYEEFVDLGSVYLFRKMDTRHTYAIF